MAVCVVGRHGLGRVEVAKVRVVGVGAVDKVLPQLQREHTLHVVGCSLVLWTRCKQGPELRVEEEVRGVVLRQLITVDFLLVPRSPVAQDHDVGLVC